MRKETKAFALIGVALCAALLAEAAPPFKPRGSSVGPNSMKPPNPQAAAANTQYDLKEITGPTGSTNLVAFEIDNSGLVSGFYTPAQSNEVRTFFIENGVFTDVRHPDPTMTVISLCATNNGRQYGNWGDQLRQTAGFRDPRTNQWTELPEFRPDLPMNFLSRMNESGLSVGSSCAGIWGASYDCVGWKWDEKQPAYQAPAYPGASPLGVNNRGKIVGYAPTESQPMQAYLEYQGKFTLLSDRPSIAWDINDAGEVLMTFYDTGENALLDAKGLHILPVPDQAALFTTYSGMNDRGDLVGYWMDSGGYLRAFVAIRKRL